MAGKRAAARDAAKHRQPNDVQDLLEDSPEDRIAASVLTPEQLRRKEAAEHCEKLGIDPDSVSDAVRMLSKKFKQGPLEILWELAADERNSKTSRSMCAQAILPYLTTKPERPKASGPTTPQTGIMIVPAAASMEEWAAMAASQQAALKEDVRK